MKVAFLGNMNNNNFAMMRYFRDLGVDAHLVLFANRTFYVPENDTWDIDKWNPYIHHIDFYDTPASVLGKKFPVNIHFFLKRIFASIRKNTNPLAYRSVSKHKIESCVAGYDKFIGSGLSGALISRIGKRLDIFYPYSSGIEYLGNKRMRSNMNHPNFIKRYLTNKIANIQKASIKESKICTTGDLGLSKQTYDEIGVPFIPLNVPMLYNQETEPPDKELGGKIKRIKRKIETCDYSILVHSRQLWINTGEYSNEEWDMQSKHNEWLFKCFADFIKMRQGKNSKLFALEHGTDVKASKQLCHQLGIEKNVVWLPKMTRKELMLLISSCDIGVGEFYKLRNTIWGGTGWEVLASGKPLLQGFNFNEGEFELSFGYPPPPMLPVKEEKDILNHLLDMYDNPEKAKTIGEGAVKWFNQYNGVSLAKKWLDLLQTNQVEKQA